MDVNVLAFYSDTPSSNPAEAYSFSCKIRAWPIEKSIHRIGKF